MILRLEVLLVNRPGLGLLFSANSSRFGFAE